jgi:hypothetical protein
MQYQVLSKAIQTELLLQGMAIVHQAWGYTFSTDSTVPSF